MRHTRSHTKNRRSHHALERPAISNCANCGKPKMMHTVCQNCGKYRGRDTIDVVGRIAKKEAKKNEKRKAMGEAVKKEEEEK